MRVDSYVASLAQRHGIAYIRSGSDALAEVITNLSDDAVVTDVTEDLLVALKCADVIDGPTMIDILGRHLDECRHV